MNKFNLIKSKNANSLAFFNILGPVILNGINFFTIPIFTRLLGTINYGQVSIYLTWVQVMTILVGLQTCGSIATATIHFNDKEGDEYCSSILFLSFCSFATISVISLLFIKPITAFLGMNNITFVLVLLNSFTNYVISFATIRFTFNKQAYKTFFISIIVAITGVVLSLIFINSIDLYENRDMGRIVGYALPHIFFGAILFFSFLLKGKVLFSKKFWGFCLPICIPLIFHGLSHIVLAQSDRIMLQHYASDDAVGVYSLVFTFVQVISIIWSALNNTWVPFYYDDFKLGNIDIINKRTKNYLFLFTVISIGFIYLSPEVIKIFASSDFWGGIDLVPILVVGMYFVFLYSFPVNFQFYHLKTKSIALGTVSAAALNIVLNYILIPRFSMAGAAYATLISYIMLFVFHHLVARFVVKKPYHYSFVMFIKYILALIIFIAIFYIIKDNYVLRWLIGFALAGVLVFKTIKNKSIF